MFTLPPSAAFLDEVARVLIETTGAKERPEALADAQIFTPNRRAARSLALALHHRLERALIAPDIRTLGDVDDDAGAGAFGAEGLDLPAELPAASRRGALARLIQAWRTRQGEPSLPPASALAAADELAALLDQSAVADRVDWSKLEDPELGAQLAEHWSISLEFLRIVTRAWPEHLREHDALDPLMRRRRAAEALADRWETDRPGHPVLILGSTGATAASRRLMRAALALPKGAIVLPGFDTDLDGAGWKAVKKAPSHPQFALWRTVASLDLSPADVRLWPGSNESDQQLARRRLVNEALAPAGATSGWNERLKRLATPGSASELVTRGLSGVRLVEAEDENDEALAAALLLRETLETPQATAALVTPDAGLGRRVAAILERWSIDIAPSAGVPLNRTEPGGFLLLLSRWALDPADPVLLLAVLKHPLTALRRTRTDLDTLVSALERAALRGPRMDRALDDLPVRLGKIEANTDDRADARLRARLAGIAQPLVGDLVRVLRDVTPAFAPDMLDGRPAAEALVELAHAIAASPDDPDGTRIWAGRAGAAAGKYLEQLAQLTAEMGGVDREAWPDFAEAIARETTAPPDAPEHPRIAIWGPLEARSQHRHRMILAGLNEGAWPRLAPADSFLNRKLRETIGLNDPDELVGLAAHDFAELANAPEVILLRARRVADKPAVASRWVWRLRTLAAGGLGDAQSAEDLLAPEAGHNPIAWAHALRAAEAAPAMKPPKPRPAPELRNLGRFSPSRTATLIRDPYADFGGRILRLTKFRRVGEDLDARERGTAVHEAIETLEKTGGDLEKLIVENLIAAGASEDLIELEKPLWLRAANIYLDWLNGRADRRREVQTEKTATHVFDTPAGPVELSATADRIERLSDGTLAIIDFKTGTPASAKQVQSGLEPQLALEAAIAARQSFGDLEPGPTSELIYFQFSTSRAVMRDKNGLPLEFKDATTMEVAEEAFEGLTKLIAQYARADTPYLSKPRAKFVSKSDDFDRLARRAEWSVEEGEE
ncbi:MAG: double-strand break repair protein AddB [Hyphomonadaceae bacterium]